MKKVFYIALIFEVFVLPEIFDIPVVILILFWIFCVIKQKVAPEESLILAAISYFFSFISRLFSLEMVMEKSIFWFMIFLTFALVQWLVKELSVSKLDD